MAALQFEHDPNLVTHIRTFSQYPRDVFAEARRLQGDVRHDWNQVKIAKVSPLLVDHHSDLERCQDELAGGARALQPEQLLPCCGDNRSGR